MQGNWGIVIGLVGVTALAVALFLTYSQHQAQNPPPQRIGQLEAKPRSYKNTATYDFTFSDDFRSMRVEVHRDAKIT